MPKEVWKDVPGYNGRYQVSNTGLIRSCLVPTSAGTKKGDKWKILEESYLSHGNEAPRAKLIPESGDTAHVYISRIVLEVFRGPAPSEKYLALRIDGKLRNVELENLIWGTRKDLAILAKKRDSIARGVLLPQHKLCRQEVEEIKEDLINGFSTTAELAEKYGVCHGTISDIRFNKNWKHIPWPPGEINQFIFKSCACCGDQFEVERFCPQGVNSKYCSPLCRRRNKYLTRTGKSYKEVYA